MANRLLLPADMDCHCYSSARELLHCSDRSMSRNVSIDFAVIHSAAASVIPFLSAIITIIAVIIIIRRLHSRSRTFRSFCSKIRIN